MKRFAVAVLAALMVGCGVSEETDELSQTEQELLYPRGPLMPCGYDEVCMKDGFPVCLCQETQTWEEALFEETTNRMTCTETQRQLSFADAGFALISWKCRCEKGYRWNGLLCVDVNECMGETETTPPFVRDDPYDPYDRFELWERNPNPCYRVWGTVSDTCTNTEGSYSCECAGGLRWVTGQGCVDIDECAETPGICANIPNGDGTCTNVISRYTCGCRPGYRWNGTTCENIDECANPSACTAKANSVCRDSDGSYACLCPAGFVDRGDRCACGEQPGDPCCGGTTCGSRLVCQSGTCQECGDLYEPCCGTSCASGSCQSGTCKPCGGLNEPCCGGSCRSGSSCQSGTCKACGGLYQPCCGSSCNSGSCQSGTCRPCGGLNQPCCGSSCGSGTSCQSGTCKACGGLGQACCSNNACGGTLGCDWAKGTCIECGQQGQPCCNGSSCGSRMACVSSSVSATKFCTACGDDWQPCCGGACYPDRLGETLNCTPNSGAPGDHCAP